MAKNPEKNPSKFLGNITSNYWELTRKIPRKLIREIPLKFSQDKIAKNPGKNPSKFLGNITTNYWELSQLIPGNFCFKIPGKCCNKLLGIYSINSWEIKQGNPHTFFPRKNTKYSWDFWMRIPQQFFLGIMAGISLLSFRVYDCVLKN